MRGRPCSCSLLSVSLALLFWVTDRKICFFSSDRDRSSSCRSSPMSSRETARIVDLEPARSKFFISLNTDCSVSANLQQI